MVYAGAVAEIMPHWGHSSGRSFERVGLGQFHLLLNLTFIDWVRALKLPLATRHFCQKVDVC